jgi:TPR repeat protein
MVNRGNRLRHVMWIVLAGVVVLLATLIVAIAMDVQISTAASATILAACGVISAALVVGSRALAQQQVGTDQQIESGPVTDPSAGNLSNWMFLADSYVERGEFESAERFYRRAADAGHGPAMARLGEVLYELGRDDEAAYYRDRARELGG